MSFRITVDGGVEELAGGCPPALPMRVAEVRPPASGGSSGVLSSIRIVSILVVSVILAGLVLTDIIVIRSAVERLLGGG